MSNEKEVGRYRVLHFGLVRKILGSAFFLRRVADYATELARRQDPVINESGFVCISHVSCG